MSLSPSNAATSASSTPRPMLDSSLWAGRLFDGDWVPARGGTVDVIEPAAGRTLTRVGLANAADVAAAARGAAQAQPSWARVAARDRTQVFHVAAAYLAQHSDELAAFIARETGGSLAKGQQELREATAQLKIAAGQILEPEGVVLPSTPGRLSLARRVPLGVVGVISPFDFPLIASMRSVAPALAAGNAVVLEPGVQTPVTGGFLLALAFQAAGLPRGVLQVMPGDAGASEALCTDPHVHMIAFTGPIATSRRMGELAGKHSKKLALDLGGKTSLIVLDDADLDLAAENVAWSAYLRQGRVYSATGRVIVHETMAASLAQRLAERARRLRVGAPAGGDVALGPLIDERERDRVHSIVTEAVAAGAQLEAGGSFEGLFYSPTVLSSVRPHMRAFREEIFGPVASVVSVASDDEAVALANATEPGRSASIISNCVGRALAIADRLHAGLVHINDQTLNDALNDASGATGALANPSNGGALADVGEYTQWRWTTVPDALPPHPF